MVVHSVSVTTHALLQSRCLWSFTDTTCVCVSDNDELITHSVWVAPLSEWLVDYLLTHFSFSRQMTSGGVWTHTLGHMRAIYIRTRTCHVERVCSVALWPLSLSLFLSFSRRALVPRVSSAPSFLFSAPRRLSPPLLSFQ